MTTMSVVMATFNGARFIERQLESICAQTSPPHELLIADDGSTDHTLDIARSLLRDAPFRSEIYSNDTNLGVGANFEQLISRADGDVIVLCDQDDEWVSHRLATLAATFDRHPGAAGVFSDADLIGPASEPLGGTLWARAGFSGERRGRWSRAPFDELMRGNVVTGATLAFRSSARPALLPFSAHGWHDHWIAALLAIDAALLPIDGRLVRYRLHDANQAGLPEMGLAKYKRSHASEQAWDHLRQLVDLEERLAALGRPVPSSLFEREAHVRFRLTLPSAAAPRSARIAREVARRRYWRYSNGWRSIAADVLRSGRSRSSATRAHLLRSL